MVVGDEVDPVGTDDARIVDVHQRTLGHADDGIDWYAAIRLNIPGKSSRGIDYADGRVSSSSRGRSRRHLWSDGSGLLEWVDNWRDGDKSTSPQRKANFNRGQMAGDKWMCDQHVDIRLACQPGLVERRIPIGKIDAGRLRSRSLCSRRGERRKP